jgi:hypothetical protein
MSFYHNTFRELVGQVTHASRAPAMPVTRAERIDPTDGHADSTTLI